MFKNLWEDSVVIIQARMASTRLPGKSLMLIAGKPLINHVIDRALHVVPPKNLYLATSGLQRDDVLVSHVKENYMIPIFRGSHNDVRSRFLSIGRLSNARNIVRLTADDPFKDPAQIELVLNNLIENKFDYFCNFYPRVFPIGLDVEAFTFSALKESESKYASPGDREHVTLALRESGLFSTGSLEKNPELISVRITIDTAIDLDYCRQLGDLMSAKEPENYSWEFTRGSMLELKN